MRRGVTKSRQEIPDFTDRADEIGHLSGALRDMTKALYNRIDAIESFAADVAHELKNPLTSLRSAVETLPLASSDDSRQRLMAIIQHDVRRLDRLISDIPTPPASTRNWRARMRSRSTWCSCSTLWSPSPTSADAASTNRSIDLNDRAAARMAAKAFLVLGHDSRLGQVFTNLIDNARSFSPPDGDGAGHRCRRRKVEVEILVEDDGPGIEPDALDRIFERFYTDRPEQGFGQNSGLGLSISRQIIEAHGGTIRAENRLGSHRRGRRDPAPRRPLRHPPARRRREGRTDQAGRPAEAGRPGASGGERERERRPSMPAACSSASAAILIRGPSGSGKSTLALRADRRSAGSDGPLRAPGQRRPALRIEDARAAPRASGDRSPAASRSTGSASCRQPSSRAPSFACVDRAVPTTSTAFPKAASEHDRPCGCRGSPRLRARQAGGNRG